MAGSLIAAVPVLAVPLKPWPGTATGQGRRMLRL
jgi:hypothetical protein